VCSGKCAIAHSRQKAEVVARKEHKIRKEKAMTPAKRKERTQSAFNAYIRVRDALDPCISCGQHYDLGQRHASHYRSRAAASQLRFNTFNVHASCAQCNGMKSGNIVEYRINLVKKIGVERVEALENNNEKRRYTDQYLDRLRHIFAKRTRHLRKLRGWHD
jgi:hypothetical protein